MNLLFSSVLIFLLLILPGFVFINRYYHLEFKEHWFIFNFHKDILQSIVPGYIIHTIYYLSLEYLFKYFNSSLYFKPECFAKLINSKSHDFDKAFSEAFYSNEYFFLFILGLFTFSGILGISIRKILTFIFEQFIFNDYNSHKFRLYTQVFVITYIKPLADFIEKIRKYPSVWNTIFKAPKRELGIKASYLTKISSLVIINNEPFVYIGFLTDYNIDNNGKDLKHIVLAMAYRIPFDDYEKEIISYNLTNNYEQFLIPGEKIENMKIEFINVFDLNFRELITYKEICTGLIENKDSKRITRKTIEAEMLKTEYFNEKKPDSLIDTLINEGFIVEESGELNLTNKYYDIKKSGIKSYYETLKHLEAENQKELYNKALSIRKRRLNTILTIILLIFFTYFVLIQ